MPISKSLMIKNAKKNLASAIKTELKSVTISGKKAFPNLDLSSIEDEDERKAVKQASYSTYNGVEATTLEHMITIITNKTIESVVTELCNEYKTGTASFEGMVSGLAATGSITGLVID